MPEGLEVPWGDTLCKRALDENRPFTDNVADCWGDSDAARALGIQPYLSSPVRGHDGELLGTLCAASAKTQQVSTYAQETLALFAALLGLFLDRELMMEKLSEKNKELTRLSTHDALTGLPNRRYLYDTLSRMLAQIKRDTHRILVCVIDMDNFKAINDRFGHMAGDDFLKQAATRLTSSLRAGDFLARLGGDEFVVVGPIQAHDGSEALASAIAMEARLTEATSGLYVINDKPISYPGASVGAICLNNGDAPVEMALRLADARMFEVKFAKKYPGSDEKKPPHSRSHVRG